MGLKATGELADARDRKYLTADEHRGFLVRVRPVDPALLRTRRISGHGLETKDAPEVVGCKRNPAR